MAKQNEWLTLKDASDQIGVNPATLRLWANQGKVRAMRTPGGHRRFSIADIKILATPETPARGSRQMEILVQGALGRAHLDFAEGRLAREDWYREIAPAARDSHRDAGRHLMALLVQAARAEKNNAELVAQARSLGERYAKINRAKNFPADGSARLSFFPRLHSRKSHRAIGNAKRPRVSQLARVLSSLESIGQSGAHHNGRGIFK